MGRRLSKEQEGEVMARRTSEETFVDAFTKIPMQMGLRLSEEQEGCCKVSEEVDGSFYGL